MKKYILATAAAIALAPAAHAATIGHNALTTQNLAGGVTQSLSVQQFDPNLGNLTQVQFFLDGGVQGTIQTADLDNVNEAIGSTLESTVSLVSFTSGNFSFSTATSSFQGVLSGRQSDRIDWARGTSFVSTTYTSVGDLNFFTGSGTVDGTASASTLTTASSFNVEDVNAIIDAGIEVVYTYDEFEEPIVPIPLPAAAWMLLAALGSLFAVRRFSKA